MQLDVSATANLCSETFVSGYEACINCGLTSSDVLTQTSLDTLKSSFQIVSDGCSTLGTPIRAPVFNESEAAPEPAPAAANNQSQSPFSLPGVNGLTQVIDASQAESNGGGGYGYGYGGYGSGSSGLHPLSSTIIGVFGFSVTLLASLW